MGNEAISRNPDTLKQLSTELAGEGRKYYLKIYEEPGCVDVGSNGAQ